MPQKDRYRALARQYALRAEHAATPLLAEGFRKLSVGYQTLAEGHAVIAEAQMLRPVTGDDVLEGRKQRESA